MPYQLSLTTVSYWELSSPLGPASISTTMELCTDSLFLTSYTRGYELYRALPLQVNDLICLPLEKADDPTDITPILACQDRTLKVMRVSLLHVLIYLPHPMT